MSESGRHYVKLTAALRSQTYGNNVIMPFLDSQPLITSPPVPLGGLGIFFKSQPGYGGFLAFKLISSKYMHFISENYAEKLTIASPVA